MNMREIKFRAWSNRDKCWCGAFSVHKSGLFTEITGARMENGVCIAYADWIDLSKQTEIVLMQYTGINDKNDKEIYEGDIVNSDYFPLSTVSFDDGAFILQAIKVKLFQRWVISHFELEVIGNIYENPELISGASSDTRD
jgi:YopX protein